MYVPKKIVILVCDPSMWGQDCSQKCKCSIENSENHSLCEPDTGQCHCKNGYKGISCNEGKFSPGYNHIFPDYIIPLLLILFSYFSICSM